MSAKEDKLILLISNLEFVNTPFLRDQWIKIYTTEVPSLSIEKLKNIVGYNAVNFGKNQAELLWQLFDCKHPVFGTTYPNPSEAFELGMRMGSTIHKVLL
jgi:hypothetical protein